MIISCDRTFVLMSTKACVQTDGPLCTWGRNNINNARFLEHNISVWVLINQKALIVHPSLSAMIIPRCLVRRPGIEPGSQEWESCMIPLHQRRLLTLMWHFFIKSISELVTILPILDSIFVLSISRVPIEERVIFHQNALTLITPYIHYLFHSNPETNSKTSVTLLFHCRNSKTSVGARAATWSLGARGSCARPSGSSPSRATASSSSSAPSWPTTS